MTAYDRIPYPSAPLPRTHPHYLGGIALQYGLDAPAGPWRVLDVGCGAGRNLCWIAATMPGSTCVGVDLAASAIAGARAFAARLDLSNVRFLQADFANVPAGEYDCIVANGLYSWVKDRARLLAFVESRLSPLGVAMIAFHEEQRPWRADLLSIADPFERLAAAKARVPGLAEFDDGLLLHDALAEVSDPISVAEFVAALPPGLEYLGDTRAGDAPPEFHEAVVVRSGRVAREPLFDQMWFVTEESFPATVRECEDAVVEALSGPRDVVSQAGEYPVAWPPARTLARDDSQIMNYFGAIVELDEDDRALIQTLDGRRRREDLPQDALEFLARAGLLIG
jgi:SAM-dependent methyltransferase